MPLPQKYYLYQYYNDKFIGQLITYEDLLYNYKNESYNIRFNYESNFNKNINIYIDKKLIIEKYQNEHMDTDFDTSTNNDINNNNSIINEYKIKIYNKPKKYEDIFVTLCTNLFSNLIRNFNYNLI